jgi:hypothetical protein
VSDGVVTAGGLRIAPGSRFEILCETWELVEPYLGTLWIVRNVRTGETRLHETGMP